MPRKYSTMNAFEIRETEGTGLQVSAFKHDISSLLDRIEEAKDFNELRALVSKAVQRITGIK